MEWRSCGQEHLIYHNFGEWTATDGPTAMGDWLTVLEPAIADLSETSEEWWGELTQAVQVWYAEHMKLSPLERTGHKPVPSLHLQQRRWQRLERRVASMLLKAVPDNQKEELGSIRHHGTPTDPLSTWRNWGEGGNPQEP